MITDEEKSDIRFYLGYPEVFIYNNSRLENAMDVVGSNIIVMNRIRSILAQIKQLEEKISEYDSVLETAGIKRVEEIEFFNEKEAKSKEQALKKEAKVLVGRLSSILGTPINGDVFGTKGYQGDEWSNHNSMSKSFLY